MTIQLPDLDDRSYEDLVRELRDAIPKYSRQWNNYNPSDPGMILLELLAWVGETLFYRANYVTPASYLQFLKLVAGYGHASLDDPDDTSGNHPHTELLNYIKAVEAVQTVPDLPEMQVKAHRFLHTQYRAVTLSDFKNIVLERFDAVKRVETLVNGDVITIIVIPDTAQRPSLPGLITQIRTFLEPRLLLGCLVTVKPAEYLYLSLKIELIWETYLLDRQVAVRAVQEKVAVYLDSVSGGVARTGRPYGQPLTVVELFRVIKEVSGVAGVRSIATADAVSSGWRKLEQLPVKGLIDILPDRIWVGEVTEETVSS